jgi:predicted RecA/RadA family phage recombinase
MNNLVSEGKTFTYTNGSTALSAGEAVIFDGVSRMGVAVNDIAANAIGEVAIVGVYDVKKTTASDNFTLGLANFKVDSANTLVLNGGTGVPNTAVSNAYVYEASASAATVKIKLLG